MKKFLQVFIFFTLSLITTAQERISADRPDLTEGATLTPPHFFQAEFGFGKENIDNENFNIIYPAALFKYGLSKRFELQLLGKFTSTHEHLISQTKTTTGFLPFTIGFRTALCEEKKILPKTSLIVRIGIPPLTSKSFKPDHLVPSFLLAMEKTLGKHIGLSSNIGTAWDGFSSTPTWLYSLSSGYELGKKMDAFFEIFGSAAKNKLPQNGVDVGLGFYISSDVKLDASAGIGISDAALKSFFGVGISFRFH
jgi:hypothetical protein